MSLATPVDDLPSVTANLNYLAPIPEKPSARATAGAPPSERRPEPDRYQLPILDARALPDADLLETRGFGLHPLKSALSDPADATEVARIYYPEVEALVRRISGARRVVAFDHNVRSRARVERGEPGMQLPVKYAHNDYTERSGPKRVRDLFPQEADSLIAGEFAVINVWRPLRGPVQDTPLAVCDATSIGPGELVATDLRYSERTGEIYSLAYSAGHRWFFYSQMQADEALLLKCYDSRRDGRSRFTAHSAFRDPTAPPDALPRESIEVRTLAFFPASPSH